METRFVPQFCNRPVRRFLPYLWGMETWLHTSINYTALSRSYRTYEEWKLVDAGYEGQDAMKFLPYLWGMETWSSFLTCTGWRRFLPYLWGMETLLYIHSLTLKYLVLTVPMRNGNHRLRRNWNTWTGRSYRTYEEWKHPDITINNYTSISFLPYLWGMETSRRKS